MSATSLGFVLALFSTICVAALAASDPKRAGERRLSLGRLRSLVAIAAILPGPLLLSMGQGVALLIWLGSAAVLGWMVAAVCRGLHEQTYHAASSGFDAGSSRRPTSSLPSFPLPPPWSSAAVLLLLLLGAAVPPCGRALLVMEAR